MLLPSTTTITSASLCCNKNFLLQISSALAAHKVYIPGKSTIQISLLHFNLPSAHSTVLPVQLPVC